MPKSKMRFEKDKTTQNTEKASKSDDQSMKSAHYRFSNNLAAQQNGTSMPSSSTMDTSQPATEEKIQNEFRCKFHPGTLQINHMGPKVTTSWNIHL